MGYGYGYGWVQVDGVWEVFMRYPGHMGYMLPCNEEEIIGFGDQHLSIDIC